MGVFLLLILPGSYWLLVAGSLALTAVAVWSSGVAEKELALKDPQSVVIDEICAMPLSLLAWVGILVHQHGTLPSVSFFFSGNRPWLLLAGFAAFRFFDIAKPWPVRQVQSLPGGWGVTVDDVLAACYVNLITLTLWAAARV
jgi:phosphatidylglycerophosphatase A